MISLHSVEQEADVVNTTIGFVLCGELQAWQELLSSACGASVSNMHGENDEIFMVHSTKLLASNTCPSLASNT